jgi:hypothetical protein
VALSTTGTLNTTGWDTRTVIDRSYGALGLSPEQITSEKIQIALDLLGLTLADMINIANPLWCLDKILITPILGQRNYPMPIGTAEINRAFYRSSFNITPATFTSTSTAYQFNFGSGNATAVAMWAVTWIGTPVPLTFQSSPDGINWTTVYTTSNFSLEPTLAAAPNGPSGTVQFYDMSNQAAAQYWQVIPSVAGNTLANLSSPTLWNTPNDIMMYRMNKDDYWNMTNKSFLGRPLQYWVHKSLSSSYHIEMQVWPQPDQITVNNVVFYIWRERYIADIGSLQQQIEVPTRWFYTVIFVLADALAFCTPEAKPDRIEMVQARLPEMLKKLWTAERDRAPVKYNVNISPYTQ